MTINLMNASQDYLANLGPGTLAKTINDDAQEAKLNARRAGNYPREIEITATVYEAVMALTDTGDIYWHAFGMFDLQWNDEFAWYIQKHGEYEGEN